MFNRNRQEQAGNRLRRVNSRGVDQTVPVRGSRKGRRLTWKGVLLLGLLIILASFFLLSNFGEVVKSVFIDVRKVERAVLEDTYDTSFIVLRNEATVAAPVSGRVGFQVDEGERVSRNSTVGHLVYEAGTSLEKTVSLPLVASAAGVVSYQIDGYENICNYRLWAQLDVTKLKELEKGLGADPPGEAKVKKTVEAGEILFKIVDNLGSSYLFMQMPAELKANPQKNEYVDVRLDEEDKLLIRAWVTDSYVQGNLVKILLQIPSLNGLENKRIIQGKLIKNRFEGFILSQSELVFKEGLAGIYILDNGRAKWIEVKVLGKNQDKVCVEGLNEENWVITAPKFIKEDQRVFILKK